LQVLDRKGFRANAGAALPEKNVLRAAGGRRWPRRSGCNPLIPNEKDRNAGAWHD
jgi:hypothetical protein